VNVDQIIRVARRAGLAAAVIGIPADLFHFTITSRAEASGTLAFRVHGLGLMTAFTLTLVAFAGLVLAQQGRAGRLGSVAAALTLFGSTFVIGDLAKEAFGLPLAPDALGEPQGYYLLVIIASFAVLAAGWFLTALALGRAGVVEGPAAMVLCVGAVLALPPIPGAYIVLLLGIALTTRQLRTSTEAARPAVATAV
jgi:hypothetical protein